MLFFWVDLFRVIRVIRLLIRGILWIDYRILKLKVGGKVMLEKIEGEKESKGES